MDFYQPIAPAFRHSGGCFNDMTVESVMSERGWGVSMNNRLKGWARAAVLGVAAVSVFDVGGAHAADLAVKAPAYKAAPYYNWTGCYVGGFVGWAAGSSWKSNDLNNHNPEAVNPFDFSIGNEAIGGGTLGCNWQANSWLVLGIEGEGGALNVEGGASPTLTSAGVNGASGLSTMSDTGKVGSGYGLIAGRVGVAFDRLLIYGKLGVAFFDTSATIRDVNGFVATGSKSQSPFAAGFGGEYAIYDHWSGKAEYVFFDRGSSFDACGGGSCFKQDPTPIHTFKIGMNYKFW
jgi:outer membrane immunogenic protein